MKNSNIGIQNKLNQAAIIYRKYNLGDEDLFLSVFQKVAKRKIDESWILALKKIQHREIIKDTSLPISVSQSNEIQNFVSNFSSDPDEIFKYLLSPFDVKELKFNDESAQRRIRHILAEKYIGHIIEDLIIYKPIWLNTFLEKATRFNINLAKKLIKFLLIVIGILSLIAVVFSPRIIEGLTPPENLLNKYLEKQYPLIDQKPITEEVLAIYLHEDSKYKFNGAVCRDGCISHSQGQGTCSHHNGVDHYFYKGQYSTTNEECEYKAKEIIGNYLEKAKMRSWVN
jgi:hypothetical protein